MKSIPLYIINGALGAGKTTLLRFLLQQPQFEGARVVENEFASESVDTRLVQQQAATVATIAGSCICCSTGDELTDALHEFAHTGSQPVIIESTGVADALRVVEQLVASDVLEHYHIAQLLYIIDAVEVLAAGVSPAMRQQAAVADLVLVSKLDCLSQQQQDTMLQQWRQQGIQVLPAAHGEFDSRRLTATSAVLRHLAALDTLPPAGALPSYTVLDLAEMTLTPQQLQDVWPRLVGDYGLRRLKGSITDGMTWWHVEATPGQYRYQVGQPGALVLIGDQAHRISRSVFYQEVVA